MNKHSTHKLPDYMEGLNDQQICAVNSIDGPLLILAGAGVGKTRTLTTRLAHIIKNEHAPAHRILAVTFTNKAALEMKDRLKILLGDRKANGISWIGTFHSVGVRILRRHSKIFGLESNFTIIDTDDQIRLMKALIKEHNIDEKQWPANLLAGIIDRFKNQAWTPDNIPEAEHYKFDQKITLLYAAYQQKLKKLNVVDFGDLLLFNVLLLQQNPAILENYRRYFRYILVDEYQDTNVAQYLWLRLLAGAHKNICCVGDDDQSIYGWRGAEVGNILRFETDFPNAQIIRLEENYRSSSSILSTASALISNNQQRLGKTLFTKRKGGKKVRLISHLSDEDEAIWIGDEIEHLQHKKQNIAFDFSGLNDIAILVRTSGQMRVFEDRFFNIGLPYRVIGGPRFYERAEIRDAIAYFRLAQNPEDDLAFGRMVNVPRRGVGSGALKKLSDYSRQHDLSLYQTAQKLLENGIIRGTAGRGLADFIKWITEWAAEIRQHEKTYPEADERLYALEADENSSSLPHHVMLAQRILDMTGYLEMWQKDQTPQASGRLENLRELIKNLENFENFSGFLEHISLFLESKNDNDEARVSLMTLHGAKGLEFQVVFLPGWEEGLFPLQRAIAEGGQKAYEEERRLAYVGITRAGALCTISYAQSRKLYGQWQILMPSPFISELPEEHIDNLNITKDCDVSSDMEHTGQDFHQIFSAYLDQTTQDAEDHRLDGYKSPGWQRLKRRITYGKNTQYLKNKGRDNTIKSKENHNFIAGMRVFHSKFGYGIIMDIEGTHLEIDFDHSGKKNIMADYVVDADKAS